MTFQVLHLGIYPFDSLITRWEVIKFKCKIQWICQGKIHNNTDAFSCVPSKYDDMYE